VLLRRAERRRGGARRGHGSEREDAGQRDKSPLQHRNSQPNRGSYVAVAATVFEPLSNAEAHTHALEPSAVPSSPPEWRAWALAAFVAAAGLAALIAVLSGAVGSRPAVPPPPVPARAATPLPAAGTQAPGERAGALVARPTAAQQRQAAERLSAGRAGTTGATAVHIERRWMEGFYPIYETAQATFGVNWLLLASIHMQESAFSTAAGTYEGLNFAGCCGGPMQFNVTNGPVSTWEAMRGSYLYGRRPASYDHMTARHPSIYDDFDAVMAAAHLLSLDGARLTLDGAAWEAAYDYYGHDATGVAYADRVLARAIGWSQHGFCINCGVSTSLIAAVQAAYGAPVQAALEAPAARARSKGAKARHRAG